MSNIDLLTAHVINLLSNAKITFSQGGMPEGTVHLTDLQNQKSIWLPDQWLLHKIF